MSEPRFPVPMPDTVRVGSLPHNTKNYSQTQRGTTDRTPTPADLMNNESARFIRHGEYVERDYNNLPGVDE